MPSDSDHRAAPASGGRQHVRDAHSDHATASPSQRPQASRATEEPPRPALEPADEAPDSASNPPLPDEPEPAASTSTTAAHDGPPLPDEAPPPADDDGWEPIWDPSNNAYYFYNRFTKLTQWENPRVPEAATPASASVGLGAHERIPAGQTQRLTDTPASAAAPTLTAPGTMTTASPSPPPPGALRRLHGGYNPAIHGDYDPDADYAREAAADEEAERAAAEAASAAAAQYVAAGSFNRFTGRWQNAEQLNPDRFSDESKSRRQMSAFFDVDAAANSHDGRSLKAERAGKKLTKAEVRAFREKRREKKEEKRRAWLRD